MSRTGGEIFISYRRADSADYTERIFNHLISEFGVNSVFLDVDSIPGGAEFPEVIRGAVKRSHVVLAFIGLQWEGAELDQKFSRIECPDDFVRSEVFLALEANKTVIPVLLDRASMPAPVTLPLDIQEICHRNALTIRHAYFHSDVGRLIKEVRRSINSIDPVGFHEFYADNSITPPTFPSNLCNAFRDFVTTLTPVDGPLSVDQLLALSSNHPTPLAVERLKRPKIINWLTTIDDDILRASISVRDYWGKKPWASGFPKEHLVSISQKSLEGRGSSELLASLLEHKVLTHEDLRVPKNKLGFGPALQMIAPCIDVADWSHLESLMQG